MSQEDLQLKLALLKMLPDKIEYRIGGDCELPDATVFFFWKNGYEIEDTAWLYVCRLAEQDLVRLANQSSEYFMWLWEVCGCAKRIGPFCPEPKLIQEYLPELFIVANAPWQLRATALAKVKGIEV